MGLRVLTVVWVQGLLVLVLMAVLVPESWRGRQGRHGFVHTIGFTIRSGIGIGIIVCHHVWLW